MIKGIIKLIVLWSKSVGHVSYMLQYSIDYLNSFIFNWVYLPAEQAKKNANMGT